MKHLHLICLCFSCFLYPGVRLDAQSFVTNGSASFLGGDCYELTPDLSGQAGTIFSQNTIDLSQPFTETATFFFGCKDANGADGIVFILTTTNTALGIGGGSLGYDGITPSIAIEYDDYQNGNFGDPASDHMAVISNGSVNHTLPSGLVAPIDIANIEDCMEHCFTVSWDPNTQTLQATLDDNVISYSGDIVNTFFGGEPNVYYGFSSATGSLSNQHIVCFGPPELEPMPDETLCEGEVVTLQADPNGIAWTWAPDPTLSSYTISNPIASPLVTTTYTTVIEYACGFLGYDTVIVNINPLPDAMAANDGPVCVDETLTLMAEGGVTYTWSGPLAYSSSSQNPEIDDVTLDMGGIYTVTVTDINGCTAEATTFVVIDEGPVVEVDPLPDPICLNLEPFQLVASPNGGEWSGDVSVDGIFDPAYVGEGVHVISYTVYNNNGCPGVQEVILEVLPVPEVLIDPPGILCETSPPVQLTGSPPGGLWTGEITLNGMFDPGQAGSGPHLITYTANDGNGCTNFADIIVEVAPGLDADITPPGPFCVTDSVVLMTADPMGGIWGGVANSIGEIFPQNLGTGTYDINYTLNDSGGCYSGYQSIEIVSAPAVDIDPVDTLCLNQDVVTMTAVPSGGIWGGAANVNGEIDPQLLGSGDHQVTYTFVTQEGCSGSDSILVTILPSAPQIGNVSLQCDSLGTSYVVTFAVTGGDSASYQIQGTIPGNLTIGTPSVFTSDPISSGGSYSFILDDGNHCAPDTISGDYTCNCETHAGTMDVNLVTACTYDTIFVSPPTGVVLDPDDSLVYVLHLGFPDSIISVSDTNFFVLNTPLQTGVTYFVSSVAGNALAGTGVDINDPCLSVSFGTPVMWMDSPEGYLQAPEEICEGESVSLSFVLSGGSGTYHVVYSDGLDFYSLDSIVSGHSIPISPDVLSDYMLVEVRDIAFPGCVSFPDTGVSVQVNYPVLISDDAAICTGDSIFLAGNFQFEAGIYVDSLTTISGCDSIIETNLILNLPDTTFLQSTSCDTSQAGVFYEELNNLLGCDSTIVRTVTYVLSDTTMLESLTCDVSQAGIHTQLYTGQSGCDSLVIEQVEYIAPDTTLLYDETCDPDATGIFSTTLSNVFGCDSLLIETISLLPSDTIMVIDYSCSPSDTGTLSQWLTNTFGCDSLVLMITALSMDDSCRVIEISKDVYVPNVFSPNNDGINDNFFISVSSNADIEVSYLRIFDRWGGLVYETIDVLPNVHENAWDGTQNGEPVSPGVFAWVAELKFGDGSVKLLSGDVTVIR